MGINYNPCVISTSARGADATAAGVNIQPNVRTVSPACLPESAVLACYLSVRPFCQSYWSLVAHSSERRLTVYTGD